MIAVGIIGLFVVLALSDPLKGRLWAAAFVLGLVLLGAAVLIEAGGERVWV